MAKHARFDNNLATGSRTASITISTTLTLSSGTINNWIDGGFGNNSTDSFDVNTGQTAKEVKFVFSVAKMITGFARYYSNNADTSQWKLQGSFDDITYVDITGSVGPTNNIAKAFSTGANDNYYLYYKLVQTSGSTSNSPWYQEIEFQIVDSGTADDQAAESPSYSNFLGSGDRRGYIIIGGTITWASGTVAIIDGSAADTAFFNGGQSGQYIEFDFGTDCLVTEITFDQSNSTSHGTWKWQKDTGGGTWVDVGSSFTLGGSTSTVITAPSGETDYYKKYRLQQVSGTNSNSPFIREITFKIGYPEIADAGIILVSPNIGPSAGGTAVTLTGLGFTTATDVTFDGVSATGITVVSDTSITLTTPAGSLGSADIVVERPTTDITLLGGFTYDDVPIETYVTQVPILVINEPEQPTRVTQVAFLVVSLPLQGQRITQVPLLSVQEPKPVPLPFPVVPEIPVRETWQYKTVVNIADKGREQRALLRSQPRLILNFGAIILNDLDRQHVYSMMVRYPSTVFYYPLYQYSTTIAATAEIGDTKIFCNPTQTDVRAGEFVALFNPLLDSTFMVEVDSIDVDGIVLSSPLEFQVPYYWGVSPAIKFRLDNNPTLNMNSIDGDFSLQLVGMGVRSPIRPSASIATLTLLGGLLLLDKMPLAEKSMDETFDQDITWLDIESNTPEGRLGYFMPYIDGSRTYKTDRNAGLDYWRTAADYMNGRLKPFYVPTFRNDLPLSVVPAPGATVFTSTNVDFFTYWRSKTHRYIRWQSGANVGYSLINGVKINYDSFGNPLTVDVYLASAITQTANLLISFVNKCRLNSDDIVLEHGADTSEITIKIRTVDE